MNRFGQRGTAAVRGLVRAIHATDEADIEAAILRVSDSRRWLAPLALGVSAVLVVVAGIRLVVSNRRLTLLQILPATWIWLAMFDLRVHVLRGQSFDLISGPLAWLAVLLVAAVTALAFHLNAVVAFAISDPAGPDISRARATAHRHRTVILASGAAVGLALGIATMIVSRHGRPWFALTLGIVIGVMMVCYVAVPARIVGVRPRPSRRDKLVTWAVSGALGAVISAPGYVLGRIGLLMLGSPALLVPGIAVTAAGFALQAGTTGAITAVKMSAKLLATGQGEPREASRA